LRDTRASRRIPPRCQARAPLLRHCPDRTRQQAPRGRRHKFQQVPTRGKGEPHPGPPILRRRGMRRRRQAALCGVLAALCAGAVLAPTASALDPVNTSKIRKALTVNGILRHERVLQSIANANGGTRVSGTNGFEASADYVKRQLVQAGYKVSEQTFEFP